MPSLVQDGLLEGLPLLKGLPVVDALPLLPIIRGVSWRHISASLAVLVTPGVLAVATDRLLVR